MKRIIEKVIIATHPLTWVLFLGYCLVELSKWLIENSQLRNLYFLHFKMDKVVMTQESIENFLSFARCLTGNRWKMYVTRLSIEKAEKILTNLKIKGEKEVT